MAQVPEVLVLRVVGLAIDLQRNVMGFRILDLLLTGDDVPLPPGGDDGHVGAEGLDGQFETDLVVAFTGAAVADGVRAFLEGDLAESLRDDRTGVGRAEQIVFILGAGLDAGHDEVFDIFVGEVFDVELGSAGLEGLLFEAFELGCLADIAGDGDDFTVVVVLLQPGDDDGCVEAAGVGENDLFDVFFFLLCDCHVYSSRSRVSGWFLSCDTHYRNALFKSQGLIA